MTESERMPRLALYVAAGAFAAQAAALAVGRLVGDGATRPVVALFDHRIAELATLDVSWAVAVLLLGGAVTLVVARSRAGLLAGWSQGAGILVVLVARLNTLADASTLVAVFALAAGAVCVQIVDRDPRGRTWCRPGAWAAAIGIVPWGVIAFGQIGSSLPDVGPSNGIRIVTLVALVLAALAWRQAWRRPTPTAADVAATTIGLSAVAWWLVVAA